MVKFVVMAMEPKIMIFDSATSLSFCTLPLPNFLQLVTISIRFICKTQDNQWVADFLIRCIFGLSNGLRNVNYIEYMFQDFYD
jgi:hypothetical protein